MISCNGFAEDAVAGGFEGIMIKSMDAPYECKRSDFWMKWKPTISVDLTIVGLKKELVAMRAGWVL
jgi:DNA ligase 1